MPHPHARDRTVAVHVVTVSTTRSAADDRSGARIREMVQAAGHTVAGSSLVPDDPEAIGLLLDRVLGEAGVDAVVLTGGTGVSARDCTPAVVRPRLDRELPGFGELFRMLSWQQVGSAAMLSDAVGGIARGRPVFALPGSTRACELAMEKLVLPELAHLCGELGKETPLPARPATRPVSRPGPDPVLATPAVLTPPREGLDLVQAPLAERPADPELATGWQAGLRHLGGTLRKGVAGEIPEALERMRPVMDVLESAGERGTVTTADGTTWLAFGWPDLVRPASKVLLVREALPMAEVVALHRWPRRVGLCAEGDGNALPAADLDPGPVSEARVGRAYDGSATLFAVDASAVWLTEGRKVCRWDAKGASAWEPVATALGTLMLGWAQR